ncbi:MAG: ATP-binding protein [Methanosphaera stadtmanae]|nr:ATP-binding protein [Methanosphaera stadtmanae]
MVVKKLTLEDIVKIKEGKLTESTILEFKKDYLGNGAKDKLLRGVCSFLNTVGGNLVYGIDENNTEMINGINDNFNDLRDKFTNIIKTGIYPNTNEFEIYNLEYDDKTLCIVNVKEGVSKPYSRINSNGSHNEFIRNNATTDQIEYTQLKRMFNYDTSEEYYSKIFNRNLKDICNDSRINTDNPFVILNIKPISDNTELYNENILTERFIRYKGHRISISYLYQNLKDKTMSIIITYDTHLKNKIFEDIWYKWLLYGLAQICNNYDKNNLPSFVIRAEFYNLKDYELSYDKPFAWPKKLSNENQNYCISEFKNIIFYDDIKTIMDELFDELNKYYVEF